MAWDPDLLALFARLDQQVGSKLPSARDKLLACSYLRTYAPRRGTLVLWPIARLRLKTSVSPLLRDLRQKLPMFDEALVCDLNHILVMHGRWFLKPFN
jgi:hypothetical protein